MTTSDLSLLGLLVQAGPVVKGVMGLLAFASLACWAVAIEKTILLARLGREVRRLGREEGGSGLAHRIGQAAGREWASGRDRDESRGEFRERIERAMREELSATLRAAQSGLPLLATTGAVGPFIGLFGTVWGIMGSFQGIAQAQDTSLAVVAPGIAEALLATAIGLVAAIPAVVAYNRLTLRVARLRQDVLAGISAIGARLSARPPQGAALAAAA
jgi:biopolymer transport protein ExbB/TolQ